MKKMDHTVKWVVIGAVFSLIVSACFLIAYYYMYVKVSPAQGQGEKQTIEDVKSQSADAQPEVFLKSEEKIRAEQDGWKIIENIVAVQFGTSDKGGRINVLIFTNTNSVYQYQARVDPGNMIKIDRFWGVSWAKVKESGVEVFPVELQLHLMSSCVIMGMCR